MDTQSVEPNRSHLDRRYRTGKTVQELAAELGRIQESKRDFIVPVSKLEATPQQNGLALSFKNGQQHDYTVNNWSGSQLANFTDIPKAYFDRLKVEKPELLAQNVNHGLKRIPQNDETKSRLVRVLDGKVRGFLSHRYRVLDGYDLMEATLPLLIHNQFEVVSSEVTEKRLYLKAVSPKITGEVGLGDVVQYGIMISTSDVGAGSLRVEPFLMRLVCLNGLILPKSFRQAHLGRSNAEKEIQELLSSETKRQDDKVFFMKVRDYFEATMRPEFFMGEIKKLQESREQKINNFDLEEVVETTMTSVGVTGKYVRDGILSALASGNQNAGLTKWGLINSFTAAAKLDDLDYDTSVDLERAAGQILELDRKQWHRIAEPTH
jgi:hypothetical protein